MLTTYGQLKSYDDFKKAFTELFWDGTRQSEIRYRYNYRSGENHSEHYITYANMPSMLSPAMSDQDLLGTMISQCHISYVRRDGRDRNPRGDSIRNPQTRQGRKSFYGGQERPNDGNDSELNAAAQDFIPGGDQRHNGSRSPNG
jgi:hypothetical protein